jgi:2-polyprenyl-3-methyl-5-hydroxy-6-metoxy-1,4-benzoquinol methylase
VSATPSRDRCLACGGADLVLVETITASALVEAWRAEDRASGAANREDRTRALLSTLPEVIRFNRCRACGLEMASPAVVWSADTYPPDQSYPMRWEFLQCAQELGSEPLDILELGCGPGEFLQLAAARGHRVFGLDFSEAAVHAARKRGLRVIRGGFDELRRELAAGARFDVVAMFHVVEHLTDPDALLAEIAGLMRPTGRLVLSCPGPRRFTRLIAEQQVDRSDFWDYPPQHVLRWTLPALRASVTRNGWKVLVATEEPLSRVAAASQIGIVRAMYRGKLRNPIARRFSIGLGWARVLSAGPEHRSGTSLYLSAARPA